MTNNIELYTVAKKITYNTLKRIHKDSANETIKRLMLDTLVSYIADDDTLPDSMDLIQDAFVVLWEYNRKGLQLSDKTDKMKQAYTRDGIEYPAKPLTVIQVASRKVSKSVSALHGKTASLKNYIEDYNNTDEDGNTLVELIPDGYDIDDIDTYLLIKDFKKILNPVRQNILHLRLKGYSQKEIAYKLKVSEVTIHRHIEEIRDAYIEYRY